MNGEEIGEILKNAYEEIYGRTNSPSGIFHGGNAGNTAIAVSLIESAKSIENGMLKIAEAIQESKKEQIYVPLTNPQPQPLDPFYDNRVTCDTNTNTKDLEGFNGEGEKQ